MFTADTSKLIPWTQYIINATNPTLNTLNFTSCVRLTPNMISQWVQFGLNVNNTGQLAIPIINGSSCSTITGGEVAAIVIGSIIGAFIVCMLIGILIRYCAYGCMNPAMVAAPKMMM